ncbi:MAG: hypothetical protein FJX76_18305 [Armatimonadetes bacterium]|nr:hypothetical protein [Armatimonadota bacterium]
MPFSIIFTPEAARQLEALEKDAASAKRFKAVRKALGYLEVDPRHQSLNTHKYHSLSGKEHGEVFEAYAESKTPAAYRIFFRYGAEKGVIQVISITPHP